MGPHPEQDRLAVSRGGAHPARPEVVVVAATGVATFIAGVAGLLQSNMYVAVPTLAAAALLGSWTLYRQLKIMSASAASASLEPGRSVHADARMVPRQLPATVSHFAGRARELAELTGLLHGDGESVNTVVISAIEGTAGVGKTALALYWAHSIADRFPDGQLYINLRGFDPQGQVMDPSEAVRRFLDALGVPPERIPADPDAQAALYRSQLAGRRMLVVLDNVRDTTHVRALLPGTPTCLVLVTSRNQLTGLVAADGAHPIALDLFSPDEAHELLTRRIGTARVVAEPQAVVDLIDLCARLPLALAIVAAHAATPPHLSLHNIAGSLREASSRLDWLTTDDPAIDVRAVLSWSYQELPADVGRLFRLLGLHPGPAISVWAAASLAGISVTSVRNLLARLARANLIVSSDLDRYTFHDLLRTYATDLTHRHESGEQRREATHRLLDHYLHAAYAADRLLHPGRDRLTLAAAQPGTTAEDLNDYRQALDWSTVERPVLLAIIEHAAACGFDTHSWQLAWTLAPFLDRQEHWQDLAAIGRAAVAAGQRLADPPARTYAHRLLARAYVQLGRLDDAHTELRDALALATEADDQEGQAHIHHTLTYMWERQARYSEALHHALETLKLYSAMGHRRGQARALNNIGWCHIRLESYRQALVACKQALDLLEELDDHFGQAGAWDSLGHAHHHLGEYALAIDSFRRAAELHRDLSDHYMEAKALTALGDTEHASGDLNAAREAWQQALTIMEKLDRPDTDSVRARLATVDPPHTA